jgi:hypothetical protein
VGILFLAFGISSGDRISGKKNVDSVKATTLKTKTVTLNQWYPAKNVDVVVSYIMPYLIYDD